MLNTTRWLAPLLVAGLIGCSDGVESMPVETSLEISEMPIEQGSASSKHATTSPNRTEFEGFIHLCGPASSGGNVKINETPGGTFHLWGARNRNLWTTNNPLVSGEEINIVDVHLNNNSGSGVVHLDVTMDPDAVEGTWEIRQKLHIRNGVSIGGFGFGHGTGELHGKTIKYTVAPEVPGDNDCSELPLAPLTGVILSPTNSG